MHRFIACGLICLTILLFTSNSFAGIASDKKLHAGFSAVFGGVSDLLVYNISDSLSTTGRVAISTAMGTFPGLLKEIADSGEVGNKFDTEDLAADIIGAFAGALVTDLTLGTFTISASRKQVNLLFQKQF